MALHFLKSSPALQEDDEGREMTSTVSGMKRAREDDQAAPPLARRREGPPLATPSPNTSRVLTRTEAFRFIKTVKREFEFAGKRSMYKDFLAILVEFHCGSLGVARVINRMQVILQGHPYVIHWFKKFLPTGYELKDIQNPRW